MTSWYNRFIEDFAAIATPITNLLKTKEKKKFVWTESAQKAFDTLKQRMISSPVLAAPNYDDPWIIETDASDYGIGAVLKQRQNSVERVIAYFSKKLSPAQRKYTVNERECFAVICAMGHFRPYIEGTQVEVRTDDASLKWLANLKDPQGRLARWALRLQAHDIIIVHRPGSQMAVADALSRAINIIDIVNSPADFDSAYDQLRKSVESDPEYRIENDILYRHCRDRSAMSNSAWKIVVPKATREAVLKECHDDLGAAHGGAFKTLHRVAQDYFWPKMKRDVISYVSKCRICKLTKATNVIQTAPMGQSRIPEGKFKTLCMDFSGPFPLSSQGNRWLLVTLDNFTKWITLTPMRTATARRERVPKNECTTVCDFG